MKTWYCVTSSFDDRGRVTAGITATKEAEGAGERLLQHPPQGYLYRLVWQP